MVLFDSATHWKKTFCRELTKITDFWTPVLIAVFNRTSFEQSEHKFAYFTETISKCAIFNQITWRVHKTLTYYWIILKRWLTKQNQWIGNRSRNGESQITHSKNCRILWKCLNGLEAFNTNSKNSFIADSVRKKFVSSP